MCSAGATAAARPDSLAGTRHSRCPSAEISQWSVVILHRSGGGSSSAGCAMVSRHRATSHGTDHWRVRGTRRASVAPVLSTCLRGTYRAHGASCGGADPSGVPRAGRTRWQPTERRTGRRGRSDSVSCVDPWTGRVRRVGSDASSDLLAARDEHVRAHPLPRRSEGRVQR